MERVITNRDSFSGAPAAGVATESRNMAAIQNGLRGMQPWFTVYFFDIGHACYDTSQNKVSPDQYHVTISRAQVCNSSRSSVFLFS